MATEFRLSVDARGIGRLAAATSVLSGAALGRVRKRVIGTLGRRVGTQAAKLIGADLNLKASKIRNRIRTRVADPYVEIIASGQGIPLVEFAGRWGGLKTPGATAQVWRNSPRRTYRGTFIARSGNILSRAYKPGSGGERYGRLPVVVRRGPSIGAILIDTGPRQVAGPLLAYASDVLEREIDRLISLELRGRNGNP